MSLVVAKALSSPTSTGRNDASAETFVLDGQNAAAVDAVGAIGTGAAHGNRGFMVVGALNANKDRGGWRAGADEAAAGHLVAYQQQGTNVGPMGTLRAGNGNETGGVPFVAQTLRANTGRNQIKSDYIAHTLKAEGHDASEDGTGRGAPLVAVAYRKATKAHGPDDAERWEATETTDTLDERDARTANLVAAPLTTTYGKTLDHPGSRGSGPANAIVEGAAVRRLTPLECERLQGFPDGWTCLCGATEALLAERGISEAAWRLTDWRTVRLDEHVWRCTCPDSPRYRAMGNAVTVTTALWIARRLRRVMA